METESPYLREATNGKGFLFVLFLHFEGLYVHTSQGELVFEATEGKD